MYYPKLTFSILFFGIFCLSNKIYGSKSLDFIGSFQIMYKEET